MLKNSSLTIVLAVSLSSFISIHAMDDNEWQLGATLEEALCYAIDTLDTIAVRHTIAAGADVNAIMRNRLTPLCIAIGKMVQGYDSSDIVQQLLSAGASLDTIVEIVPADFISVRDYAEEALRNYLEELNATMSCQQSSVAVEKASHRIQRVQYILKLITE